MYSFRPGEFTEIFPSDVVLLEGILVFYNKEVRDLFDMKLFVDTDADTRLARRGEREYLMQVQLAYAEFGNDCKYNFGLQPFLNYLQVLRDIEDRGRDLEHILQQYTNLVKPAFEEFCLPVSPLSNLLYN